MEFVEWDAIDDNSLTGSPVTNRPPAEDATDEENVTSVEEASTPLTHSKEFLQPQNQVTEEENHRPTKARRKRRRRVPQSLARQLVEQYEQTVKKKMVSRLFEKRQTIALEKLAESIQPVAETCQKYLEMEKLMFEV